MTAPAAWGRDKGLRAGSLRLLLILAEQAEFGEPVTATYGDLAEALGFTERGARFAERHAVEAGYLRVRTTVNSREGNTYRLVRPRASGGGTR